MPFVKGQSGNPGGRPKRHIADLSRECRKVAHHVRDLLVKVVKDPNEKTRDRITAGALIWAYGYGRPMQQLTLFDAAGKVTPEALQQIEALTNTAAVAEHDFDPDLPPHPELFN
jgi:hypothetical protein